ncbi:MAG: TRAP transporter large permease subunit, partial [Capnocytophaga gingivalis]|uniref:TRAP transporter large permease subunit n=1 Tax=Capnocytophaga gingivalis TaxID=1017 RepID=UPI00360ECB76
FKDAFWALMPPVLLFGGIVSGVFTPTDAAVFAAFYSLMWLYLPPQRRALAGFTYYLKTKKGFP